MVRVSGRVMMSVSIRISTHIVHVWHPHPHIRILPVAKTCSLRLVDSGSINVLANDISVNFCNKLWHQTDTKHVYSNTEPVWSLVISVLVTWKWPLRRSSSFRVTDFGTNRKLICDSLLVFNTNLPPILHRFQVMAEYWSNFRHRRHPCEYTDKLYLPGN